MEMRSERWSSSTTTVVSLVNDPSDHHHYSRFFDNKPIVLNSLPIMNCSGGGSQQMFPIRNCGVDVDVDDDDNYDENMKRVDVVDFFSEKRSDERLQSRDADDGGGGVNVVKSEMCYGGDAAAAVRPSEFDVNTGLNLVIGNGRSEQSTMDDGITAVVSDEKRPKIELSQLQMELGRMNAENVRLKEMLSNMSSNYQALEFRIRSLMEQQASRRQAGSALEHKNVDAAKSVEKKHGVNGLVESRNFLEIGRGGSGAERDDVASQSLSGERTRSGSAHGAGKRPLGDTNEELQSNERNEQADTRGDKRLKVREVSPDDSDTKVWPSAKPGNILNTNPAKASIDQQSAEATMRKARVSVRARSEAPMISDGCQWRKYGQKMAKGNPCPRAYYRCTMAVGCPVRKQIQRCAEDQTILVTTYEGNHNHPLPPAAIPMASTTTAAATMLLSGSMSSADGLMNPNFLTRTMLPCSNMATISASAPFPTVTLDLTHPPPQASQHLQRQHPQAQFQSPFGPQTLASLPLITNSLPQIFSQALPNQSKFSGLQVSQDTSLAESMAAAITANPNLHAIILAAISNAIAGGANNSNDNNNNNNNSSSTTSTQQQ